MRKATFLFLAVGALLAACEKEVVGVKLPGSERQLVVNCLISPDDQYITAFVARSRPVFGDRDLADTLVEDATVTLSDGTLTIQLLYDDSQQAYLYEPAAGSSPLFTIVPGRSYTLGVTTPRGEAATAACTVPAALEVPPTVFADSAREAYHDGYYYRMRMSWPDPPGRVNYYRAAGWLEEVTSQNQDGTSVNWRSAPVDWRAEETISDAGQDGQLLVSPWGNWRGRYSYETSLRTSINAHLLHTDRHYYHYHRSVRRAKQSQANPFAEPVLIYSNVTGGLGVFGAYTRTTAIVRIK